MKKLNKIFRTDQISAIDRYTIENEPISSLGLMERAAGVWTDFFLKFSGKYLKIVVVAGSGNNGGDGFVIARLLKGMGKNVVVFHLLMDGQRSPDCEANYKRWLQVGGGLKEVTRPEECEFEDGTVIVDAIFGSGLNRPVAGLATEVIRRINNSSCKVVAVDIPSGLMGEDNMENDPQSIVRADYTFTFQFPKLAFMLPENAGYLGKWYVLDIGLHPVALAATPASWYYTTEEVVREILPVPEKYAHKGCNGKGLLIAGHDGMMGATVLAAKAALRSGIGLLYCHVPARAGDILQITVPEAILEKDKSGVSFSEVKNPLKYDAIAVGPALGQGPEALGGLRLLLQAWKGFTILDADALNLLSEHQELLKLLHEGCILTPHMKEFERLAGKSKNDFDRLNKLSNFANQYQVYIVLKGAHTVIATPEGELHFNMSGNPGMAKGGTGDVLTGILLALAANRMDILDIVRIGVYAHGLAADLLAEEQGFRGISSGMIAEGMGLAWCRLENGFESMKNK